MTCLLTLEMVDDKEYPSELGELDSDDASGKSIYLLLYLCCSFFYIVFCVALVSWLSVLNAMLALRQHGAFIKKP